MILQSLVRLAERQGLTADDRRGFDDKPVHWIIDIDCAGNVVGVTSTAQKEPGAKKDSFLVLSIPQRSSRTSGVSAELLVDNAQYLFGIGDPKKDFHARRIAEAMAAFRDGLTHLESLDPMVGSVLTALGRIQQDVSAFARLWSGQQATQDVASLAGTIAIPKAWASNHLFIFRCQGIFLTGIPAIRDWISQRARGPDRGFDEREGDLCLVTGAWSSPKPRFGGVNLPGDTGPVPLISFNCSSFWHHRRENNENAPISVAAADAVFAALQFLLKPGSQRSLRLNGKTTVLFWSDAVQPSEDDLDSLLGPCLDADPAAVRRIEAIYAAPRDGRALAPSELTAFCSLVLTREKKRVSVRSAVLSTASEVGLAVRRWFTDLAIDGAGERPYQALWMLTKATASAKAKDAESAHDLSARLYQSAIGGGPLPMDLLATLLRRVRTEGHQGITPTRIALIKATLIRSFQQEIPVSLDPDHPAPAYHLGRLFAVLEAIQDTAINANAGIADRYLGAAMGTPALVFPRLLKMHHHHLGKIGGGLAVTYGRTIDAIISRLPAELPSTQALREQGTFMVGYHHQRSERFKKVAEPTTSSKDQP